MYEQGNLMKAAAQLGQIAPQGLRENPTVGENIDAKIARLRQEIERLEESKQTLAPLLGMRIQDIAEAMRF